MALNQTAIQHMHSVGWHRGIDQSSPCMNTTGQIDDLVESVLLQKLRDFPAAGTVVTDAHNRIVRI